jgi:2-iminobutanoate/2-iminopropanoate deaminase
MILPDEWDPEVAAKFGYSFGVLRDRCLWVAGQVAMDERGRPVAVGDIEGQARKVFDRIRAIVQTAGGTMADVVKTTTYITDRSFRPITNKLRTEYFPGPNYPANTLVIVAGLALPEYLVEIEATAVVQG